jgi:hypothetical protein
MLTNEEIEKRKPLWLALSDLWLDTEPTELTYQAIVREISNLGYSFETAEKIMAEEVAPVVYSNLFNIFPGGTWDGFDADWLNKAIIQSLEKQEKNTIYRTWTRSSAGKFVMTNMVRDDWRKVARLYQSSSTKP